MQKKTLSGFGALFLCLSAAIACGSAPESTIDDGTGSTGGSSGNGVGGMTLDVGGNGAGGDCTNTVLVRQGEFMVEVCADGGSDAGGNAGTGGSGGSGGTPTCEDDSECPANNVCEDHLCQGGGGSGGTSGSGGNCNGGAGSDGGGSGGSGNTGNTDSGGSGGTSTGGTSTGGTSTGGTSTGGTTNVGGSGSGGSGGGCQHDSECPEHQVCESGTCGPHCGGGDPHPTCDSHKATICHIPPGNPENLHTICVGKPAVPAHLAHGDYEGACKE